MEESPLNQTIAVDDVPPNAYFSPETNSRLNNDDNNKPVSIKTTPAP